MPNIDEKVVQMQFDNSEFDPNIKKSQKTFEEFEKTLEFDKGSKALKNFQKDMDKVDTKGLSNQLGKLGESFSALETVAVGALLSVGNRLENFLNNTLRTTLIQGANRGWEDYAEKVTSVQTIMAATSSQFSDTASQINYVTSELEELRTFTDETSYSFKDMTNNIGKFTSQGVKLNTAVTAMQGISTWASLSGASTAEASRAMYNISQAIGTGAVQLIDWKSIENANMATVEFKQTALDTAVELGKLKKIADGTYQTLSGKAVSIANFNQNLNEKWFTSDVLLKSLDRYGGFAQKLLTYTNEMDNISVRQAMKWIDQYAEGMLTLDEAISLAGDDGEKVAEMLKELGKEEYNLGRRAFRAAQETKTFGEAWNYVIGTIATGWAQSWELIFGDYNQAREFWTDITDDLYEIFITGGEFRNEVLELWSKTFGREDFVAGIAALRKFFFGYEEAGKHIMGVRDFLREAWESVFPFWRNADSIASFLVRVTKAFRTWAENLRANPVTMDALTTAVKAAARALKFLYEVGKSVVLLFAPLVKWSKELLAPVAQLLKQFTNSAGALITSQAFLEKFRLTLLGIGAIIALPIKLLTIFFRKIQEAGNLTLPEFLNKLKTFGAKVVFGFWEGFLKAWKVVHSAIIGAFNTLINAVKNRLQIHSPSRLFYGFGANTGKGFFNGVTDVWSSGLQKLRTNFEALSAVFNSGVTGTVKFTAAIEALGHMLLWLIKIAYEVVKAFFKLKLMITVMMAINKIIYGVGAMAEAVPDLLWRAGNYLRDMGRAANITALATLLKSIAISVAILAGTFILLSKIELENVKQGIVVMTVIMALLAGISIALINVSKKFGARLAATLLSISATILVFSVAMLIFIGLIKKIIKIINKLNGHIGIIFKAIGLLAAILASAIIIVAGVSFALQLFKKECTKMAKNMLNVAVSIALFLVSLLIIGKIFEKVLANIGPIIGGFVAFIAFSSIVYLLASIIGKKSSITKLGGLIGALSIMTLILLQIFICASVASKIRIESIIYSVVLVSIMLVMLTILGKLANYVKSVKISGILKAIGILILLNAFLINMIPLILVAKTITLLGVLYAGLTLSAALLVLGIVSAVANFVSKIKVSGLVKAIGISILLDVFIGAFKLLVNTASTIPYTSMFYAAGILAAAILVMSLVTSIASAIKVKISDILKTAFIALTVITLIKAIAEVVKCIESIENIDLALSSMFKILAMLTIMVGIFALISVIVGKSGAGLAGVLLISIMLVSITTAMSAFASVLPSLIASLYLFTAWLEDFGKNAINLTIYAALFVVFSALLLVGAALVSIALALLIPAVAAFVVITVLMSVALAVFTGAAILLNNNSAKVHGAIQSLIMTFTQPGLWKAIGAMSVFGLAAILLGAGSIVLGVGLISLSLGLFVFELALPIFEKFINFMKEFINWDLVGKAWQFLLFAAAFSLACMLLLPVPILITALAIALFALSLSMMFISANLDKIVNGFSLFTKITWEMVGGMAKLSLGLLALSVGLTAVAIPAAIIISVLSLLVLGISALNASIAALINAFIALGEHTDAVGKIIKAVKENINDITDVVVEFGKKVGEVTPQLLLFGAALIVIGLGITVTAVGLTLLAIAGLICVGVLFLFVLLLDRIKTDHPRLYETIMDIAESLATLARKEAELYGETQSLTDHLSHAVKIVLNLAEDLGSAVGSVVKGIGDVVGGALTGLGNLFSGKNREYKKLKELAELNTALAEAQYKLSKSNVDFVNALGSYGPNLEVYAGYFIKITKVFEDLGKVAKTYSIDIKNLALQTRELFNKLGRDTIEGYLDGLIRGNDAIEKQANHMVTLILNTMKKGLDIHSPSKKMYEIGEDAAEGFTLGSDEFLDKAVAVWKNRLDRIYDATKKTTAQIQGLFDEQTRAAYQAEFDMLDMKMKHGGLTTEEYKQYYDLQSKLWQDAAARRKQEKAAEAAKEESATFGETLKNVGSDMKTIIEKVKSGEMTLKEGLSAAWSSLKTNFGGFLGDKFGDLKEWLLGDGGILSGFKGLFDGITNGDLFKGMGLEDYLPKIDENTEDIYDAMNTSDLTGAVDPTSYTSGSGNTINTYEFVQNNYSPKALSRIEIYRQTNRQFNNFRTREVLAR